MLEIDLNTLNITITADEIESYSNEDDKIVLIIKGKSTNGKITISNQIRDSLSDLFSGRGEKEIL